MAKIILLVIVFCSFSCTEMEDKYRIINCCIKYTSPSSYKLIPTPPYMVYESSYINFQLNENSKTAYLKYNKIEYNDVSYRKHGRDIIFINNKNITPDSILKIPYNTEFLLVEVLSIDENIGKVNLYTKTTNNMNWRGLAGNCTMMIFQ